MKNKLNKLISIILIAQMLFVNLGSGAALVIAEETPTPEPTQEASVGTTATVNVEAAPTTEPTVTQSADTQAPSPTPSLSEEEQEELAERQALLERRARSAAAKEAYLAEAEGGDSTRTTSATSASVQGVNLGGDASITTGDANSTGNILNSANNNLSGSAGVAGGGSGAQVATTGNGSGSTNTGAIVIDNTDDTNQGNAATIDNSLNQSATTGNNSSSGNVGVSSSITTGDANVTGTIINAVNTNVDGVIVSEFNVADNHTGDLVLDFTAGCISGCGAGPIAVSNTGNGSDSTNTAGVTETNNNTTTQVNDALIGNELILNADTGNNTTSSNTGGDSNITTGDANVSGNVLNFVNTNVSGNVIYGVINIFGELIGDIILTEDAINNCCGGSQLAASNTGNGTGSTNTSTIDVENNNTVLQTNDAIIDNALVLDANTGANSTSSNTGGDSIIKTGDVDVQASLLNVVNTNLIGGNMWLVIVNEAGKWVGKLLGAPEGSNFAASSGSEYTIDENGYITVTNSSNGSGSTNTGAVNQTNNNTTTQTNTAQVGNILNLSANTGGNTANDNTGGSSNITTGDANIIANLVNFVNTNIVGDGKLVVAVVNVFGSWIGDFIAPGQQKVAKTSNVNQQSAGGTGGNNTASNNQSGNQAGNNGSQTNSQSLKVKGGGILTGAAELAANIGSFASSQAPSQNSLSVSSTNDGESKVAGVSTSNNDSVTAGSNKIKINLAWLVVILPAVSMVLLGKKLVINRYLAKRVA